MMTVYPLQTGQATCALAHRLGQTLSTVASEIEGALALLADCLRDSADPGDVPARLDAVDAAFIALLAALQDQEAGAGAPGSPADVAVLSTLLVMQSTVERLAAGLPKALGRNGGLGAQALAQYLATKTESAEEKGADIKDGAAAALGSTLLPCIEATLSDLCIAPARSLALDAQLVALTSVALRAQSFSPRGTGRTPSLVHHRSLGSPAKLEPARATDALAPRAPAPPSQDAESGAVPRPAAKNFLLSKTGRCIDRCLTEIDRRCGYDRINLAQSLQGAVVVAVIFGLSVNRHIREATDYKLPWALFIAIGLMGSVVGGVLRKCVYRVGATLAGIAWAVAFTYFTVLLNGLSAHATPAKVRRGSSVCVCVWRGRVCELMAAILMPIRGHVRADRLVGALGGARLLGGQPAGVPLAAGLFGDHHRRHVRCDHHHGALPQRPRGPHALCVAPGGHGLWHPGGGGLHGAGLPRLGPHQGQGGCAERAGAPGRGPGRDGGAVLRASRQARGRERSQNRWQGGEHATQQDAGRGRAAAEPLASPGLGLGHHLCPALALAPQALRGRRRRAAAQPAGRAAPDPGARQGARVASPAAHAARRVWHGREAAGAGHGGPHREAGQPQDKRRPRQLRVPPHAEGQEVGGLRSRGTELGRIVREKVGCGLNSRSLPDPALPHSHNRLPVEAVGSLCRLLDQLVNVCFSMVTLLEAQGMSHVQLSAEQEQRARRVGLQMRQTLLGFRELLRRKVSIAW